MPRSSLHQLKRSVVESRSHRIMEPPVARRPSEISELRRNRPRRPSMERSNQVCQVVVRAHSQRCDTSFL